MMRHGTREIRSGLPMTPDNMGELGVIISSAFCLKDAEVDPGDEWS
jgi:hypothetical protein